LANAIKTRVCFLVGSLAISGGTYVILQHASHLQNRGYDVTLAVQEPFTAKHLEWHDQAAKLRCLPIDLAKKASYDLVIASWWKTVFELKDFNSIRYGYFIQSIESRFYPEVEAPLRALVDSTYRFPLSCITEASWIKQYLSEEFGQVSALVRNGIRKDIYTATGVTTSLRGTIRTPRILVEGHFGVSFKNTALGIRLAREAGATDIWVLTGSPANWIPGVNKVFSCVPMMKTPEIYRSCDILVKLSTVEGMFGPPLEMFHCGGTAVVFNVTGHDEYIVDGRNARVVSRGDSNGVVSTLRDLLTNRDLLSRLQNGALYTANAWPSWEKSSSQFLEWVNEILDGPTIASSLLADLTEKAFVDYTREEQLRLARNPWAVRRHKLSELASRMPKSLVRQVKQLEAVGEVLFCGRKTC